MIAADRAQSRPATPSATASTDSPRTTIVKSAKRSGTWLVCTGIDANR